MKTLSPILVLLAAAPGYAQQTPTPPATPMPPSSTYVHLGGIAKIAKISSDFVDRLFLDSTFAQNPRVSRAMETATRPGLKVLVAERIASATGGPQKLSVSPANVSNFGLDLGPTDRANLISTLKTVLTDDQVTDADQKVVMDAFAVPKPEEAVADPAPLPTSPATGETPAPPNPNGALYDRIGGIHRVSEILDDWVARCAADPAISGDPGFKLASDKLGKPGLVFVVTELIAGKIGGPQGPAGSQEEISALDSAQFSPSVKKAAGAHLQAALDAAKNAEAERNDLFRAMSDVGLVAS